MTKPNWKLEVGSCEGDVAGWSSYLTYIANKGSNRLDFRTSVMDRIRNHLVRCNLQGLGIGPGHNYLNSRNLGRALVAKLFAHGPAKGELKC